MTHGYQEGTIHGKIKVPSGNLIFLPHPEHGTRHRGWCAQARATEFFANAGSVCDPANRLCAEFRDTPQHFI